MAAEITAHKGNSPRGDRTLSYGLMWRIRSETAVVVPIGSRKLNADRQKYSVMICCIKVYKNITGTCTSMFYQKYLVYLYSTNLFSRLNNLLQIYCISL